MKIYTHGGDIYDYKTKIIDFSSNINPLGMPESVKRAIGENIDDFAIYPDHCSRALVNAIAKEHRVKEEYISLGNGAADIIYRLCISQKPKEALVMAPSFSEYEEALSLVNAEVKHCFLNSELKLDRHILDINILKVLDKVDMIFVCNPNNPTGLLIEDDILEVLEEKIRDTKTLLVVDECFLDFAEKGKSLISKIETNPNIVIIKAFTKFYALAGIRLGYMLSSNKSLNDDMGRFAPPWNISKVAQLAGIESLKDYEYKTNTKNYVAKEREFLIKELKELKLRVYKGEANYLLFYSEDMYLRDKLIRHDILIRDCSNYNNLSKGYYRVAVKKHEDNVKLIQALKREMES